MILWKCNFIDQVFLYVLNIYLFYYYSASSKNELDECLSLNSEYVSKGYQGLKERLEEMPSEWTLVQITRNYVPKEIVMPRPSEKPVEVGELFITRYQCGQKYKNM